MADQQAQLNSRALEIATEAKVLIQSHIRECSETRDEIIRKFEELKSSATLSSDAVNKSLSKIYSIMWQAMTALLVILTGAVAYFLTHDGLPGNRADPPATTRHL